MQKDNPGRQGRNGWRSTHLRHFRVGACPFKCDLWEPKQVEGPLNRRIPFLLPQRALSCWMSFFLNEIRALRKRVSYIQYALT